jgi:transcriptional regulator with AAA-type ATPase domain/ligand-binding sensor domain-containing protein
MNQLPLNSPTSAKGTWRTYSLAEGLCGIQVEHIAEDHEGYLWFATYDNGVSRFDGDEFRTYTRTSGLCGNQVMCILSDSQNRLWFATRDGGACWYDGQYFHKFTGSDNMATGSVSYIAEDRQGRIWFSGETTLGFYENEVFHDLHPEYRRSLGGHPTTADFFGCFGIAQDSQGHIWLASNPLTRYDGHAFKHYGPSAGLPTTGYSYSLAIDLNDNLWIGGEQTIGRLVDHSFYPEHLDVGAMMRKIEIDREGRVWFCTAGRGVICYDGERFERLTVQDGLAYDMVNSAFEDREGHIWFSTWGGGVSCWAPRSMQVMDSEDGTALEGTFTLLEDQHKHLWLGFAPTFTTLHKNVAHYDGEQIIGVDDIPDLGRCWTLCADEQGYIYFGGDNGLARYDGAHFSPIGPEQGFDGHSVHALTVDRQGNLLIGYSASTDSTAQIARYDGAQCTLLFADAASNAEESINALVLTRQDALWFGYGTAIAKDRGKGIGCLRPGAGVSFHTTAEGLADDRVEDLLEDHQGRIWIATLGGLSCFDGIRLRNFTTEDGLPNNRIRSLCEDRQGHLWLGTDSGVVRYDGQRFQTIRSPLLSSVTSIVEDHNGHLWFAALHHVVRYQPSTTPPKCRIVRVLADQWYKSTDQVEITADNHQVIFEYKGMSFRTHPKDMLYSHRLRGYEEEWQPADNAEMRAYYHDLPPGDYTFEVRAADCDFNHSEPAVLPLKINPDPRVEMLINNAAQDAENFVGQSAALRRILSQIHEVAHTDLTVLALGETGTGKGLVARALHRLSKRSTQPLIQINCGALPTGLIESEFFGHEKGAFTSAVSRKPGKVELAQGGTLFLDEVGDLTLEAQVKLLRLLEERTFERVGGTETFHADVRVVAATNRNLQQMVAAGTFREDLYFRLQVFPLQLPPLRQRRDDILQLAIHFMENMAAHLDKEVTHISPEAVAALQRYDWPGNVRELEHSVQRAVIICKGSTILARDIALELPDIPTTQTPTTMTLYENERRHILMVLEQTGWIIKGPNGAADILGLPSSTLRSRMKKLEIQRPIV